MDECKNPDTEIVLQRVLHCVPRRRMVITRHQHFAFELIYLLSGDYEYRHNELLLKLKGGEGVLIRPGDWHTDYISKNTNYIAVNFVLRDKHLSGYRALLQGQADESFLRYKDDDKIIKGILTKLLAENSRIDAFSTKLQQAHVLELFWRVLRRLPREALSEELLENEENVRFQEELQNFFLANIHKSPGLDKIASHLYLTPRTLSNRCRALLRMSPIKAFLKVKMDYSMKLLTETDMSVKEISEYLGFKNPYHFSSVFKRFFMHSPASFRKDCNR